MRSLSQTGTQPQAIVTSERKDSPERSAKREAPVDPGPCYFAERWSSGRRHSLGKRAYRKVSRVRIPPLSVLPPPSARTHIVCSTLPVASCDRRLPRLRRGRTSCAQHYRSILRPPVAPPSARTHIVCSTLPVASCDRRLPRLRRGRTSCAQHYRSHPATAGCPAFGEDAHRVLNTTGRILRPRSAPPSARTHIVCSTLPVASCDRRLPRLRRGRR